MTYDHHLITLPWSDYELLDSGDSMKLERFGAIIVARPETQALWKKQKPELWESAHAEFAFRDKKGAWTTKKQIPESWSVAWKGATALAHLTGFKHTGIFPEQSPNWEWLSARVADLRGRTSDVRPRRSYMPKVLNLFGYTGIASIAVAHPGAFVTHVDASKQSLDWAHENARLSGVSEESIRWVLDDALVFAKREARRLLARGAQASDAKYDGIILDPPAFGRGAKGEVWKIEEDLPKLLDALKEILSDAPGSFFLINGYAAGYAPRAFAQAIESTFGEVNGEAGELFIQESSSARVIPAGIYVRFVR